MVWRRIVAAAALAALAAGAAGNAVAQVTADASLSHLSYRLIDLDPNDGIAPSLSLSPYNITGFVGQTDLNGNQVSYQSTNGFGTLSYDNNYGNGLVEIQDNLVHILTQTYSGTGAGLASRVFNFTLSPNTEVIFSADADISASTTGVHGDIAQALVDLTGEIPSGPNAFISFDSQAQVLDGSQHLTLSAAANSGADWTYGHIGLDALSFTSSTALPVPEPTPAAMLIGGLGIVAAFLRQRRAAGGAAWRARRITAPG